MPSKASEPLLQQLSRTLKVDAEQREAMINKIKVNVEQHLSETVGLGACACQSQLACQVQGIVVFVIDGLQWTLDLREGKGTLVQGPPMEKADITLTIKGRQVAQARVWHGEDPDGLQGMQGEGRAPRCRMSIA
jgi:hypothetical protein